MKAKCSICKKELSVEIDRRFEKFDVGRATCLKCGSLQKRYISEADLLLYLGCIETLYSGVTILAAYTYDNMNEQLWLAGIFAIVLIATYFIQKTLSRYIYNNAPFKKEVANKVFDEDPAKVKKNINTQFVLFFVFAIGYILVKQYRIDFIFAFILDIVISFLRFVLAVRKEKA